MNPIPLGTDLFQIPYKQPPPNVQSDFTKRSDLLNLFYTLIPIIICITTLFMIFRLRARVGREERWRIDDWLTTATWIFTTSLGILLMVVVQKLGRSTWDISIGFLSTPWPERILVSMDLMLMMSLLLGKLSTLALHYRFFGHMDQVRRQLQWTTILCFPLFAAIIILPVLASPPLGKPWGTLNPYNLEGSIVAISVGIVNILVDFLALYIPIPCVLSMHLSPKKKAGVLAVFLTGFMAIIADAIFMYYHVRLWKQIDPLRDGLIVGICSFVEASVSIICSSMPCAVKVWKVHIISSDLYHFLRSRFTTAQTIGDSTSLHHPSEFAMPQKPQKKKRRGLYSIETLPTTVPSTARFSKSENLVQLGSVEAKTSGHYCKESLTMDHEHQEELKKSNYQQTLTQSSLSIQDVSNYLSKDKITV